LYTTVRFVAVVAANATTVHPPDEMVALIAELEGVQALEVTEVSLKVVRLVL